MMIRTAEWSYDAEKTSALQSSECTLSVEQCMHNNLSDEQWRMCSIDSECTAVVFRKSIVVVH